MSDRSLQELLNELGSTEGWPSRSLRERIASVQVGAKWHNIAPENQKLTRFEQHAFFNEMCVVFTAEPGPEYVVPIRKVAALRVMPDKDD